MAAVMNLGPQPTVDPLAPSAVEVHLLDRRLDLAGSRLTVQPLRLLRRQQGFSSLEALSGQIRRDADLARQDCLAREGTSLSPMPGPQQEPDPRPPWV